MSDNDDKQLRGNTRGRRARARLLDVALAAFADSGFHATSTRAIAQAAGMSPAAMYAHYATKEDLLFELSHAGHLEAAEAITYGMASSSDPRLQLREIMRTFAAWHARRHTVARVVQYEIDALAPEHAAIIFELRRQMEADVRSVLARGTSRGLFVVDDLHATALALLSLGIDTARWFRDGGRWTPEQIAELYAVIALRMVGCEPTTSVVAAHSGCS